MVRVFRLNYLFIFAIAGNAYEMVIVFSLLASDRLAGPRLVSVHPYTSGGCLVLGNLWRPLSLPRNGKIVNATTRTLQLRSAL